MIKSLKFFVLSGGSYNVVALNTATNYADSDVTNGIFYYYVVTATNVVGESAVSAEIFAQPKSLVPPSLPADHLGWRLQVQTNPLDAGLGTNWTTMAGSATTNQIALPLDAANNSVFFRLIYP